MRSDGTDLAKLTCNAPSGQDPGAYQPDWSPDGRQIAFDLYGDIDVMTPAGADMHRSRPAAAPSFSPDGSQLAYAGPPFGSSQGIHILTLASGADARLTSGYDGAPAWSPDGTTIVFAHADDPARNWVLQTIGADGRGLRTIVDTVNPTSVDWAADTSDSASEPDVTAADTSCAETASAAAPAAPPCPVVEQSPPTVIAPGSDHRARVIRRTAEPVATRRRRVPSARAALPAGVRLDSCRPRPCGPLRARRGCSGEGAPGRR